MADVRILNVPYKGTAPALTDVLGGQADMMFISLVTGAAQVRAGKLRAYGVTSAQRQPSFPDLPAIGEIVQGFESTAWFGVFGPAGHPIRQPVDAAAMPLDEHAKGFLVAASRLRDGSRVVQVHLFL